MSHPVLVFNTYVLVNWIYTHAIFTWAYPKGSPSLKLPFIFVCVQSQIAVWALQRTRPFASLLSLRMRTYAHQHMVKNVGFISSVVL